MGVVLAGVAPVEWYDSVGALVMTAKLPTDSGLNVSVSEDVIRGGFSNQRISSYFYDSNLAVNVTSPTFDKQYLVQKLGSSLEAGGDVFTIEEVTVAVENKITVADYTPVAPFEDDSTVYGWYKVKDSGDEYTVFTFSGSEGSVSGLEVGTELCVKYAWSNPAGSNFKVSSSIIPNILKCIMKIPELKGNDSTNYVDASKVGEMTVYIPKYQFDPNTEISLTSGGHATTSLSGNALVNEGTGCDSDGWYAKITEEIYGMDEFDNVSNIIVSDAEFELGVGDTTTLEVYKLYTDGRNPALVSNNGLLTFVSETPANATVGANTGLVTGVLAGESVITVVVTANADLDTVARVTVS